MAVIVEDLHVGTVVDVPIALYNVDVSIRPDGVYVMVANSLDLTKIHRFLSDDGLTWTAAGTFPIGDDLIWKPTPHVTWSDSTNFELWSGRAESPENVYSREIHRWQWQDVD